MLLIAKRTKRTEQEDKAKMQAQDKGEELIKSEELERRKEFEKRKELERFRGKFCLAIIITQHKNSIVKTLAQLDTIG